MNVSTTTAGVERLLTLSLACERSSLTLTKAVSKNMHDSMGLERLYLSLVDPPLGVLLELVGTAKSSVHFLNREWMNVLGEPKSNLLLSVLDGVGSVADVLSYQ
jgi:hypothetical protein